MMNKKITLYYVSTYLLLGGIGLSLLPETTLALFQSNGSYGLIMPRFAGMFMIVLSYLIFSIARKELMVLYKATIWARLFIVVFLSILYSLSADPLFIIIIIIVLIGLVPSLYFEFYTSRKRNMTMPVKLLIMAGLLYHQQIFCQGTSEIPYANYAPLISPDGSKVVYASKRKGNWDIYTVEIYRDIYSPLVIGKNELCITNHEGVNVEPSWSPSGNSIAFISNRTGNNEIFVTNTTGSKTTQVTFDKSKKNYPLFSRDGNYIYYTSQTDTIWQLQKLSLESGISSQISELNIQGRIRLSTGGNFISFTADYQGRMAIYLLKEDGTVSGITETRFDFIGNPHFSEKTNQFLFDAHKTGNSNSGDGNWEIWISGKDGNDAKVVSSTDLDDWGASWSRKSDAIVYSGGGKNGMNYEIFYYEFRGKAVQLTKR